MLAGAGISEDGAGGQAGIDWGRTVAGPWLGETLAALQPPRRTLACRSRSIAPGHAASLSARRRAMALSARTAAARRLPGRRHGSRQDHPGAVAAAGAQERARARTRVETVPAGGTSLAARQLGRGDRALRAEPQSGRGASFGTAGPQARDGRLGRSRRGRSRHHQLRLSDAHAMAFDDTVAAGGARRGPGHQERGRQADQNGQEASRPKPASP